MKLIIVSLLTCLVSFSYAADLFVQEFGGGGTYATISDAITAAGNGDRILVQPKSGNAPYVENLTVNKTLQILTASNGNQFFLLGNVTVATNLNAGSTVVIDGINIPNGGIFQTSNSINAVNVYIVNSTLQIGFIRFAQRFNVTIANSFINSTTNTTFPAVDICKGHVLGNTVTAVETAVRFTSDATTSTDTLYIVGNRISVSSNFTVAFFSGINWQCSTAFFCIANNFVQQTNTANALALGNSNFPLISISNIKGSTNSNERNLVMNNTATFNITTNNSQYTYIGISGPNDPGLFIFNNLVHFNSTTPTNRIGYSVSSQPQFSYNNASNASTFNLNPNTDPTNTSTTVTISNASGCLTNNPDLGHPNAIFTDLDLTRNDWGACGGSFNISVNYPTSVAGTAKVHLVLAPRRVLQGGTISINAEGHDR